MSKDREYMSFLQYKQQLEKTEQLAKEEQNRLKKCAQKVFQTEEGQYLARYLIRFSGLLQKEDRLIQMSDREMIYRQVCQDIVKRFLISIISKETFIDILRKL